MLYSKSIKIRRGHVEILDYVTVFFRDEDRTGDEEDLFSCNVFGCPL